MSSRNLLRSILLLALVCSVGCGDDAGQDHGQVYDARGRLLRDVVRPPNLPNLLVLVIDALRADALEPGGGDPDDPGLRMPFLASLARRGTHCTNAVAPAPWTVPSMMSLLTGLHPSEHGQYKVHDQWHLPAAVTTLPEVLQAAYAYETAALVNGVWFQRSGASLLQGFTHRRATFALQGVEQAVGHWNQQRDPERPFFLLLHTFEAHDPYGKANHPWPPVVPRASDDDPVVLGQVTDPPEIFRRCFLDLAAANELHRRLGPSLGDILQRYKWRGYAEDPRPELAAELREAYWDGARWVDGLLARSWRLFERLGLLENTVVVITADHGEAFGEHGGLAHGLRLYDELVRIPLVALGPGPLAERRVVDEDVGLIDVLPTFLDLAGLPALEGIAGRSFLPVVRGETWCRPVVSEERLTRASTGEQVDAVRISARTRRWKYIATYDLRTGVVREEAYDLLMDPEELDDLAEGSGRLAADAVFDACLCKAMEAVRMRIWGEHAADPEAEVYTTPYGASAPRVGTPRPAPCNGGA